VRRSSAGRQRLQRTKRTIGTDRHVWTSAAWATRLRGALIP
jgi:hypothetical protein